MGKKIVVITGSPRKNGNSFAMTEAFIQAAQAKGHTVTRFDAALMKWKMVGEVLVPGVLEAGAIAKTDGCAQAAALAEKF